MGWRNGLQNQALISLEFHFHIERHSHGLVEVLLLRRQWMWWVGAIPMNWWVQDFGGLWICTEEFFGGGVGVRVLYAGNFLFCRICWSMKMEHNSYI
jgi:hypothetical protein